MSDERSRTKSELKHLFTNLSKKSITEDMISILIDVLWRDKVTQRTSGFEFAGGQFSEISFAAATRIFTIKPFDPAIENYIPRYCFYSFSLTATFHRVFQSLSIEIPNEEGLYLIYFDTEPSPGREQILTVQKNPTTYQTQNIIENKAFIASVYWNETAGEALYFGNERHGSEWNPQIQWYLHKVFGARRKNGLQFTGYSLNGDGSSNDHARFNITGGTMLHDDFELEIACSSTSIPILYSFGTLPRFLANSGYAFAGATRVYYNSGQISLAQADSGNFVLYHIFATNEILTASRKIISVMGTAQYTTLADAYKGVEPELDGIASYVPMQGRCYLGSIIIQTSDDYTNAKKARIVALTGNEISHPPVTIAEESKLSLAIDENQELRFLDAPADGKNYGRNNKSWVPVIIDYDWNLHSPEEIIGYLTPPEIISVSVNGSGSINETIAPGAIKITAINNAGETLPTDCPTFDILTDSTEVIISWDAIPGSIAYRIYYSGNYFETESLSVNFLDFIADTPADLPLENTAAIYQSPFTIDNGDTVKYTGKGIDVETSVDETDSTLKNVLLKKQQSRWDETDENSPNFIVAKPTIPQPTPPYILPIATTEILGGIKLGTGLTIEEDGTVNVSTTFLGLDDVIPESYVGKAWNVPRVTDEEDGLDFVETEEIEVVDALFKELIDCPTSYAGYGGYLVRVKLDETGLEFIQP